MDMREFRRCVELAKAGVSAVDLYVQMSKEGIGQLPIYICLREEFNLGFVECKATEAEAKRLLAENSD